MNAIIEARKEKCKYFFKINQKLLKCCNDQGHLGGIELQNNERKIIIKEKDTREKWGTEYGEKRIRGTNQGT